MPHSLAQGLARCQAVERVRWMNEETVKERPDPWRALAWTAGEARLCLWNDYSTQGRPRSGPAPLGIISEGLTGGQGGPESPVPTVPPTQGTEVSL